MDGELITVAQYFQKMASTNPKYADNLPNGRLRFPHLPTLNVGSKSHPMLIPVELVFVLEGQSRQRSLPPEISNNIIRYAAQPPDVRFDHLTRGSRESGIFNALQHDPNAEAFGLNEISSKPMKVQACILPPAKLQYGNRIIEPELRGTWNLAGGVNFAHPAKPDDRDTKIKYAILVTYDHSAPNSIDGIVREFQKVLEGESRILGIPMELCTSSYIAIRGTKDILEDAIGDMKRRGARIVVALLHWDVYSVLKLVADRMCMPTQCVKWNNVLKPPRNYQTSLLVKMNYKMGGVNHTLASRVPLSGAMDADNESFQSPPKSISWFFDEYCMVMVSDILLVC
jgi:eukaryotic translation initiation factor 2C